MNSRSKILSGVGLGAAVGLAMALSSPASAQQQPAGSYLRSCRVLSVSGGSLTAECRDMRGGSQVTSIPYVRCHGDIGNNNGVLQCNGATATFGGQGGGGDRGYQPQGYPPQYGQNRYGGGQPYPRRPYDQPSYGQGGNGEGGYGEGGYGEGAYGGDFGRAGGVYPEFARIEDHIRDQIRDGVRDDLIERDDARDLFGQLRDIQARERREFQVHGWNLPDDDRASIRAALRRLDRLVDQTRDEP